MVEIDHGADDHGGAVLIVGTRDHCYSATDSWLSSPVESAAGRQTRRGSE